MHAVVQRDYIAYNGIDFAPVREWVSGESQQSRMPTATGTTSASLLLFLFPFRLFGYSKGANTATGVIQEMEIIIKNRQREARAREVIGKWITITRAPHFGGSLFVSRLSSIVRPAWCPLAPLHIAKATRDVISIPIAIPESESLFI